MIPALLKDLNPGEVFYLPVKNSGFYTKAGTVLEHREDGLTEFNTLPDPNQGMAVRRLSLISQYQVFILPLSASSLTKEDYDS